MKSFLTLITILAALLWPVSIHAQKGLNINKAFTDRYRDMKGATETLVVKDKLRNVNLDTYHSLSIAGHPETASELERMVLADARTAVSKEVRYKAGHLYYGLYRLPSITRGVNRYIIFLNGHLAGDNKIILLYLEGKASTEQVKKMLK
ncbi:MAG: DUF6108 family protein [Firmicutes bacterium]|nr:DUF6108 family protein [Bacillota bacterium]MCM1400693.1 DUF6108 family protein [Bacteroides sp.]MCM1476387.1 DUF6108 family protein [Bacteroides sp.]